MLLSNAAFRTQAPRTGVHYFSMYQGPVTVVFIGTNNAAFHMQFSNSKESISITPATH